MTDEESDEQFLERLTRDNGYLVPKVLPGGRWAAVAPMLFTMAIITGEIGDDSGYQDRWCYHNLISAILALDTWNGSGEPPGWHRHPSSGRRIARTVGEIDNNGQVVPVGEEYVAW